MHWGGVPIKERGALKNFCIYLRVLSHDQFHWKEIEKCVGFAQKVRRGDIYPRPLPHLIIVTRHGRGRGQEAQWEEGGIKHNATGETKGD